MASTAEKLRGEDLEQIQGLVNNLRRALEQTPTVDLAGLLPPPGDRLRLPALRELIRADLDFHWCRRQPVLLEDYLTRLPELKDDRTLCLDLLYAEYETRRRYGDSLSLKKLQSRFPELFPELRPLIESNAAADDDWCTWATLKDPPSGSLMPAYPPVEAAPVAGAPAGPAPAPRQPGAGGAGDARPTRDPAQVRRTPAEVPAPMVSDNCGQVLPITGGSELPITGGYKLLTRLGSGTYGEVWRAEAPGGVEVALKIIFRPLDHADARREREALELISRLHHPFLVATHQFYALQDRLLIAMDLADGSLRDRLKECREAGQAGIAPEELLRYVGEAAEALDYLHAHQVLHRDIKPDNILLFQGHARVGDFGLARMMELTGSRQATTTGTPVYMAPEVWNARMSAHSDQYSLAATYVELRLGRPMFSSTSLMQLMFDHLEHSPDLGDLPQAEREVVLKALAKDPNQRYACCRDFHRALAAALATRSPSEETPSPSPARGRSPVRWRRVLVLAAGLMAVALLALGAWQVRRYLNQPTVYLPPDCQPEKPVETQVVDGRALYQRIAYVLPDGTRVVFVLVPRGVPEHLPSFYIMEDKVSRGLFEKFVAANPQARIGDKWRQGTRLPDGALLPPQPDTPVFNVTALDALRFAEWLGGNLPTVLQWDKAAGRFEPGALTPGRGPFIAPWVSGQIAVGRDRPMPCGEATHDVSPFGCRDMAGNGTEWTRSLVMQDNRQPPKFISLDIKDHHLSVHRRGRSYREPEPYTFDNSFDEEAIGAAKPFTSFRVVLELPAEPGPAGQAAAPESTPAAGAKP